MTINGVLDQSTENRAQFVFKSKREHIRKVNISNLAYPNKHIKKY